MMMRPKWVLLALVLALNSAVGGESVKEPLIRMPVMQAEVTPVAPDTPVKLDASKLYVIDSELQLITLCSPNGVLKVVEEPGPIRIRGIFADGSGKVQTRNYKGKFIYTVEVADGKSGLCELLVVPVGVKAESEVIRRMIEAGNAPQPPPKPVDPPKPIDPPKPVDPAPIPVDGFRVLVVYESADLAKLAASQVAILTSGQVRGYLNDKCVKGPDGKTKEWRVWDQNTDVTNESKVWQDAMKVKRDSVPWIIVSDGKTGFSGPLPVDINSTLALLKKYGGN